ncbi:hypothetical protein LJ658_01815 [Mucilaginibacter sp. UR6-11]|nr:hypothetical protein [Mucilaginibacter sp. UR6-11]MCC8423665.1 hypothetical protein [Mucilaginibacter sp. UR6-11]
MHISKNEQHIPANLVAGTIKRATIVNSITGNTIVNILPSQAGNAWIDMESLKFEK